jgi:hypothetical protein
MPISNNPEAGESRVRNRAGKFCRQSIPIMLCTVLLHAVNLRNGTDGFTSPPKVPSAGVESATLGAMASKLTTRPPRVWSLTNAMSRFPTILQNIVVSLMGSYGTVGNFTWSNDWLKLTNTEQCQEERNVLKFNDWLLPSKFTPTSPINRKKHTDFRHLKMNDFMSPLSCFHMYQRHSSEEERRPWTFLNAPVLWSIIKVFKHTHIIKMYKYICKRLPDNNSYINSHSEAMDTKIHPDQERNVCLLLMLRVWCRHASAEGKLQTLQFITRVQSADNG